MGRPRSLTPSARSSAERAALLQAVAQSGLDRRRGCAVVDAGGLTLQVLPLADSDVEELAELAGQLHAELLSVDAVSVGPLPAEAAPERAKGLDGTLIGW